MVQKSKDKRQRAARPGEEGWQARKSAATRRQIIGAAIRCIVDYGYPGTTMMNVSEQAGLSRGATLHHYPSKMDIIRAVVEHLNERRIQAFRRSIEEIPSNADIPHLAVQSYFEHINHPAYIALFELSVAARTDPELQAILRPAQQAFDNEWYKTARDLFPDWQKDPQAFDLALDLSQIAMEGMVTCNFTHARRYDTDRLLAYLEEKIRELRP